MATAVKQRKPAPRPAPQVLVSITEAARRIGVSRTQVRRYAASGHLDYGVLPSGRRMILESTVDRFVRRAMDGAL